MTVASVVALLYELHFIIIFCFYKASFHVFQHLSFAAPRPAPAYFSRQSRARIFGGGAALSFCVFALRSALRLCYASRTDERGRNGRGSPAPEGRNASSSRLFTRARADA